MCPPDCFLVAEQVGRSGSPPPAIPYLAEALEQGVEGGCQHCGVAGQAMARVAQSLKVPPHGGEPGVPHRGEALGECRVGLGCLAKRADLREVRAIGVPVGGYPGTQGRFL